MSKPTVVLVPGCWHVPKHYAAITTYLESKGYNVICEQNPSCGASDPSLNNNDDAVAIRKSIDSVDGDVVVAMHSYGGVPGAVAATGAKNVIGLIFFAAFVVESGGTVNEAPGLKHPDPYPIEIDVEKGVSWSIRPGPTFYHDVDKEKQEEAIKLLALQNISIAVTPTNPTSWPHLPKIYIFCTDDEMLPLVSQETMAEKAGGWLEQKRIHSGHSPWLSKEKEFNEMLEGAVQTLVENKSKA